MSKKRIIAIVTIIVLLFAAGISVGVFLYGRGETQATDGNETVNPNQPDGGTSNLPDNNGTQTGEGNGQETNPDTGIGTQKPNGNVTGTVDNNGNVGNAGVTTNPNVDQVGETTITRVEEQERLVSKAFWDWWKPMSVAITPSNIGVEVPQITVKKATITGVGGDQFVYAGQDITYVIAVANNSDTDVENIEVTDKIPQNTTFVSIEDAKILKNVDGELSSEVVGTKTTIGTETTVGVKWVISIPAGETVIAKFTVNVNEDVKGTISNVAIANGEESNDGEQTKTAIIESGKSSVITRDGQEVEIAKIGDLITYTITVENTGDIEGTTNILDTVPEGTKFVSAQEGATVSEAKDTVLWSVVVPAGKTVTREFIVEVTELKETITNIAYVDGIGTETDTVKVEAYIQFVENGGSSVEDMTGYAGQQIEDTTMPSTEKIGYDFDGWYADEEFNEEINELPAEYPEGITIYYAKWVPRTDTQYKVEHHLQDLDLNGYTLNATENKTGTTGEQTQAVAKDYPGFTAQTFEQKEILGDGSTVVQIYYTRNTNTEYKVEHHLQNLDLNGYILDATENKSGITGAQTQAEAKDYPGFTAQTFEQKEILGDGSTVVKIYYTRNTDTQYKVEHYLQDLDLNGYTLDATENKTGTTGEQTQAEAKDYSGFTAQSFEQKEILGDGSTVVKIYYTRNTNTGYKVEHYLQNLDLSKYILDATENKTGTTGAQTEAVAKEYIGFTAQSFEQKEILGDGSTVVEIYYTRNTDTQYKVEHHLQNLELDGYTLDTTENKTGTTGEQTQAVAKEYPGFTAQTFEQKEILGDGSTVVKIYYTRNTDTQYKVEHYLQNLDLNGYTLHETENKAGTTGAQTEAVAKEYPGFIAQSFEQKEILANGSTVVQIYYTRNTNTQYKVEHYLQNLNLNGYTLYETENKAGLTGAQTEAEARNYLGFIPQSFEQKEIAANGSTVIEIYYTRNTNTQYKVEHYLQDLDLDGYTLDATENKSGITGAQTQAVAKEYAGFTAQSFEQKEILGNGLTVVEIYYTRNTNTQYKVEHYLQDLGLNGYTLDATENKTGITGEQTQAVAKEYPGFTAQSFEQKEILGNGSTVVQIYYTRNSNTVYKVEHYLQDLDLDGYTLDATENKTGITGAQTQALAKDYPGFRAQTFEQKEIAGDSSTVVQIYYTRKTNISYTIKYYFNMNEDESKRENGTAIYGQQIKDEVNNYATDGWILNENISTKLPYIIQDLQTANVIEMYYEKADISVTKESFVANQDGSVVINDERNNRITYRITAKNNGFLPGTVTIADAEPSGTQLVGDIILTILPTGETTVINKDVFATTGVNVTLQHNEEAKIEFTVKVINVLPGVYVENTPIINGETDNTNKVENKVEKIINVKSKAETIKGTNIVIVIDLSASMNDIIDGVSKLEAAKDAAQGFISKIFENGANGTQVSVVTFNFSEADKNNYRTETDAKYVGTKVFTYNLNNETKTVVTNKAEADALIAEIEKIQLESNLGTNMGAGLIKAEEQIGVLNQLNSSNEDVIIFLGDGDPEGGGFENQKANIINKASTIKNAGTKIYTIGFGLHQELEQFCCYTTPFGILVPFKCELNIAKDQHTSYNTIFGNIHHHKTTVYEEDAISILRSIASGNTDAEKEKYARSSDDAESLIQTFESISKDIAYTDKNLTSENGLIELTDIYVSEQHPINITVNGVAQTPITSLPTQENDKTGFIVLSNSKYYLNLAKFDVGAEVSVEFFAE